MTNGFNNRHSQPAYYPYQGQTQFPFTGCAHPPSDHNSSEHHHSNEQRNHNSAQSIHHSKPSPSQPQPQPHPHPQPQPQPQPQPHPHPQAWSPPIPSSTTHTSAPSADKQKVLSPSLPDPSPSSSCSSAERTTIHQPIVTHPAPATSSLELPSVDTWIQSANSSSPSNYLHRNNIPPPIFIPSPASSSTTNLKSNLDQFKHQHRYHHPNENLLLGDNTNTTQNKTIIQHSNFHAHPRASVPPLSAPIIHSDSRWPTKQPTHLQSEKSHLRSNPSAGLPNDSKALKDIKRRTTKACDNCRKSKCKCTRAPDADGSIPTTGPCQNCVVNDVECTFNGTSRKRGPPKGYIEAIELRLHRLEALLGGLLENDDTRVQALFSQLISDNEVRKLLTSDLKVAAQQGANGKPRKSWKSPDSLITSLPSDRGHQLHLMDTQKVLWGVSHLSPTSAEQDLRSHEPSQPNGQSSGPDDDSEDEESQLDTSPPPLLNNETNHQHKNRRRRVDSQLSSMSRPKSQVTSFSSSAIASTIPHTGTATFTLSRPELTNPNIDKSEPTLEGKQSLGSQNSEFLSTKQHSPATITELADVVGQLSLDENDEVRYHGRSSGLYLISASQRYKDFFWQFPKPGLWPVAPIRRSLTTFSILEVVNPLELLQSRETMNHFLDLYWMFVHPMMPILYKSEFMTQFQNLMANLDTVKRARPHWSLNQIWCHAMCRNSASTDGSLTDSSEQQSPPIHQQDHQIEPPVRGLGPTNRISVLLLLVMFSISSRYSDRFSNHTKGQYSNAGDDYLEKARQMLNLDYANSKLTNCQSLLLMAYREIGAGAMAESWLYTGMAIRMAQDMGLFRDVDKWFMPVKKFTYEDKQIRKRVWWACVNMDKYVSTYIGRPMMIFERDYDTAFPSTDEPDEHDRWGESTPKSSSMELPPAHPTYRTAEQDLKPEELDGAKMAHSVGVEQQYVSLENCPTTHQFETMEQKSHTISCFNRSASLSVLISRVVANIYAIRVRVIAQSSETLLSLLDQNLARWYLDLPEQLRYRPQSITPSPHKVDGKDCDSGKRAPTPHLLTLHAKFYTALILLHRPFIPPSRPQDCSANSSSSTSPPHPSHSICTIAANAITNIAQAYHEAFGLSRAPAFMVYYIFTAAILHVNNASSEAGLALTAKSSLLKCLNCLKEMTPTWTGAVRAWELLSGLVDLRDVDLLECKQQPVSNPSTSELDGIHLKNAHPADRGLKRPASSSNLENHLSHCHADQKNAHSLLNKSTTGNNKFLSTSAGAAHMNSRSSLRQSSTSFRSALPRENRKPLRSVSTSDWSTMSMNAAKHKGECSENPSISEQATSLPQQCQSEMRSPGELGMGLSSEKNSSRGEPEPHRFSAATCSNPMLLHPPVAALPTTAMEEMMGFWSSSPNLHEHYHQQCDRQTLHQQQQPPRPSNFSSPIGNPPYEPHNEQDPLRTTIQGIFGLGGSSQGNYTTTNESMPNGHQRNGGLAYENQVEGGRVEVRQEQQAQPILDGKSATAQNATKDGTLSELGLSWFAPPVDAVGDFTVDPSSLTLLTAHSQPPPDRNPPPYHQLPESLSGARFDENAYSAIHF